MRPLSAATDGERVRIAWASPACELASVRVYRRRQHVGTEAEIHPVVFFGNRRDTTIVHCWDTLFTELGIYEYRLMPVDSAGREGPSSPWTTAHNLHEEARPWLRSIHAEDVPGARSIRLRWTLENPQRARGIAIHRAEKFDGPYLRLADVDAADTVYTDRVQRVKETYFYRVEVVDVVGRFHREHARARLEQYGTARSTAQRRDRQSGAVRSHALLAACRSGHRALPSGTGSTEG